jgi:hypothetical protein
VTTSERSLTGQKNSLVLNSKQKSCSIAKVSQLHCDNAQTICQFGFGTLLACVSFSLAV